jgi:hypothetical protein
VAQLVHQSAQVFHDRVLVVAALRAVGVAGAAVVGRDHGVVLGQRRDHIAPFVPGLRKAVDQQHRLTLAAIA